MDKCGRIGRMDWRELGPRPGKSVASQEVELEGTFETISLVISQVRKLRLKEGSAKLRLTRPVSCVPALTHLSLSSAHLRAQRQPQPQSLRSWLFLQLTAEPGAGGQWAASRKALRAEGRVELNASCCRNGQGSGWRGSGWGAAAEPGTRCLRPWSRHGDPRVGDTASASGESAS